MYDSPGINYVSNFFPDGFKPFPTSRCAFRWVCPVTTNDSWHTPIRFMFHMPFKPF